MKAILISIQSPHACNILNLIKLWEIRKKFPKDYVGWVYIYVTKGKLTLSKYFYLDGWAYGAVLNYNYAKQFDMAKEILNGKVVARFWCDKVDEFYNFDDDLCKQACLDRGEMLDYLGNKNGYAIHITKLEIFDKPKELWQFYGLKKPKSCNECPIGVPSTYCKTCKVPTRLTRAPQSWCYVEV